MNAQDQTSNVGVDLDSILNFDTAQITYRVPVIFDADGEPKSGFIIVGKNSPQYLDATGKVRVGNIMKSAVRRKPLDTSTEEGAKILTATLDNNSMNTALAVTVGWFGWQVEGQDAQFDRATLEKMLTKFPTWKDRIINDLDNDGNFIKV